MTMANIVNHAGIGVKALVQKTAPPGTKGGGRHHIILLPIGEQWARAMMVFLSSSYEASVHPFLKGNIGLGAVMRYGSD